jgi:SAM-dependent MidA family methyltransferase
MTGSSTPVLRLDEFMRLANMAYYAQRDPFADFTTSPEITQVFGELLGAWAAVAWQTMGAPSRVALVEVGPGRGTLMQDVLRCVERVAPGFAAAAGVHFVETSRRLRAEQARRVPAAVWHDGLATLPGGPCLLLANEFLDALPIRQFLRREGGWTERFVQDGAFVEIASAGPEVEAAVGSIVEVSDVSRAWLGDLSRRLVVHGGAALILDYGTAQSLCGDSLQALARGRPAHVDFAAASRAAQTAGATVWGPVTQGDFLARLGLWQRTEALEAANPGRAVELREAAIRLAAPERMGHLFKVMCVSQPGFPVPPGFEP